MTILNSFKMQLLNFLDELISQYPSQSEFVVMRIFVKDQIPIQSLVDKFIKNILPHENLVKTRNDSLFKIAQLVEYPTKPDFFRDFWFSNILQDDDKEIIWKWMDVFILLVKKINK